MQDGFDIIRRIWKHSPTFRHEWHFVASQDRRYNSWVDSPLMPQHGPVATVQPEWLDLYFAPLGFVDERRSNQTATGFAVLFADIDEGKVYKIDGKLPSYLWATSPGMYQAVWLLDKPLPTYEKWADLNQRMTYFCDADKGGWMGSKVLRIPGTLNWKRASGEGVPRCGAIISKDGTVFSTANLQKLLPPVDKHRSATSNNVPSPGEPSDVAAWIKRQSMSIQAMFARPERVSDRSEHIVRTINRMKQQGIPDKAIYRAIYWQPWNKFRDRPEVLWSEIFSS